MLNKSFEEMTFEEFEAYVHAEMEKDNAKFEAIKSGKFEEEFDKAFEEFDKEFEEVNARISAANKALEKEIEEINRENSKSSSTESSTAIRTLEEHIRIHNEMDRFNEENMINHMIFMNNNIF